MMLKRLDGNKKIISNHIVVSFLKTQQVPKDMVFRVKDGPHHGMMRAWKVAWPDGDGNGNCTVLKGEEVLLYANSNHKPSRNFKWHIFEVIDGMPRFKNLSHHRKGVPLP